MRKTSVYSQKHSSPGVAFEIPRLDTRVPVQRGNFLEDDAPRNPAAWRLLKFYYRGRNKSYCLGQQSSRLGCHSRSVIDGVSENSLQTWTNSPTSSSARSAARSTLVRAPGGCSGSACTQAATKGIILHSARSDPGRDIAFSLTCTPSRWLTGTQKPHVGCLGLHQVTSTPYKIPRNFRQRHTLANDHVDDRYAHREPHAHQSPPGEVANLR